MTYEVELCEAEPADARAIADIHLAARRQAMPWLRRPFTDAETRSWFAMVVADSPATWWIARSGGAIVAYMKLEGEELDHLYVSPSWQRQGIGTVLLNRAKALSPHRLALFTFQRNAGARAFYEAHGFHPVSFTGGDNQENEPDVRYEWGAAAASR